MKLSAPLVGKPDREAGRVGVMGREMGEEGVLSDAVPELFVLPGLESVFR